MVRRRARAAVAKLYGAGGAVLRTQGHRHFCGAPGPRGRHAFKAPGVLPHRAHAHCSEAAGGLGRATGACAAHPAQADGRAVDLDAIEALYIFLNVLDNPHDFQASVT